VKVKTSGFANKDNTKTNNALETAELTVVEFAVFLIEQKDCLLSVQL